ncbi:UNVERIFIED_CONTAM: retroviral-like aspartic protease [Salmonella enterica subsp. enterica serovar Weltevreden]
MSMFKQLNVNVPFAEALSSMPVYAKFLKDILSNKTKLQDFATVVLSEGCSAVLQHNLPPKGKDPGSFSIPCAIGNVKFENVLCDLGAAINLMPYYVFKRLGLGECKATTMTIQLADRSIKYPRGVVEDVLVGINKYVLPCDFVMLNMEEDSRVPLILGRPFLPTGRALIDCQKDELYFIINQ